MAFGPFYQGLVFALKLTNFGPSFYSISNAVIKDMGLYATDSPRLTRKMLL